MTSGKLSVFLLMFSPHEILLGSCNTPSSSTTNLEISSYWRGVKLKHTNKVFNEKKTTGENTVFSLLVVSAPPLRYAGRGS